MNLFVLDGRRVGPMLCRAKGDLRDVLAQHIHQCSKMLARGHPGTERKTVHKYPVMLCFRNILGLFFILFGIAGAALCVVCHPFDVEAVSRAMDEDQLNIHHEYLHASIKFDTEPFSFQQVVALCQHVLLSNT